MLLWEGLPSAQAAEVQAIFLFDERCRLAGNLVQASAGAATRVFAFRPAPGSEDEPRQAAAPGGENEQMALIAADMAAGLRLIYTSAPSRLRLLAARAQENAGLLPRQGRGVQSLPAFREVVARVRLLTRQARSDTEALRLALQRSGESLTAPEPRIALSTGIWRLGVALSTLLQSGREVSLESTLDRRGDEALAALALARSVVRPSDWSSRAPVDLSSLVVLSGGISEHFTRAVSEIVAELRSAGFGDAAVRTLLERRQVPGWLISRVLRDNTVPWRRL